MRWQFVLSEMFIGLRRNLTLTIAVIITVAISLQQFGTGLLVRKQIDAMKDYWYDKVEVSMFLDDEITAEQERDIRADLEAMPEVKEVLFESKAEAFERFKEQFKDSPAIVENVTPDVLPKSYRIKLVDPNKFEVVESAFAKRPGIDQVLNQREVLKKFFDVLGTVSRAALIQSLFLLAAAALLVGNTIRVAAFSRRRETGIMRLVGASNLYIQLPFLLEGAIAGFIGSLFAALSLMGVKVTLIDRGFRPAFQFTTFIGWEAVWAVVPIIFLVGIGLSSVASFITLRRYLRV